MYALAIEICGKMPEGFDDLSMSPQKTVTEESSPPVKSNSEPQSKSSQVEKKIHVTIVGAKGRQKSDIEKHFKSKPHLQLSFLTPSDVKSGKFPQAGYLIVTQWVDHATTASLKANSPAVIISNPAVTRGFSSMRKAIDDLLARLNATK